MATSGFFRGAWRDARWGELLVAYVVMHDGQHESADALSAFARSQLAPYKLPKSFQQVEQLPRNANGKVLKTTLRELHAATEGNPELRLQPQSG